MCVTTLPHSLHLCWLQTPGTRSKVSRMCQAFEPATSTQDKSLSAVGLPTRTTRRAYSVAGGSFLFLSLSLSFFFFTFSFLFYFVIMLFWLRLLLLLCRFRAAFAFCSVLLGYVSRFKFAFFFFLFLEWLFSRVTGSLDTWIGIRLRGSRTSRGFQDPRSSNPSEQNCGHRSRVGSLNLWILEFLESENSRSSSPRILRHSIFGILNLQILGFFESSDSKIPEVLSPWDSVGHLTPRRCEQDLSVSLDPPILISLSLISRVHLRICLVAFASLSPYVSFHSLKSPPILLINVCILFIYVIYILHAR